MPDNAAPDPQRPTFTAEDLAVLGNDADKPTITQEAADDLDFDPITDASVTADPADKGAADTAEDGDKGKGSKGEADAGKGTAEKGGKAAASKAATGSVLGDEDGEATDKADEEEAEAEDAEGAADKDDAADADADKTKGKGKAGDWRQPYLDRAALRIEKELKPKVLAKDYDKEFKRRMDAVTARMARYKSADDWMDSRWSLEERISSGEFKATKLPDNATPKEVAAWRKDNGIPEKADAYDIPKVAGHQWTEADNEAFNARYKPLFHEANLSQAQVNKVMTAYAQDQIAARTAYEETLTERDNADQRSAEDQLRADPDIGNTGFRPFITIIDRLLQDPENKEFRDLIWDARNAEGHLLRKNPAFLKRVVHPMAIERYGDAGMPSGDVAAARSSRKAEIEKIMNTDMNEYYRQGLDKEYTDIIQAEEAGASRRGGRRAA